MYPTDRRALVLLMHQQLKMLTGLVNNGEELSCLSCDDEAGMYGTDHHHLVPEWFVQLQGSTVLRSQTASEILQAGDHLLVPPGVCHWEELAVGGMNVIGKIIDGQFCFHCTRRGTEGVETIRTSTRLRHFQSIGALLQDALRVPERMPQLLAVAFELLQQELLLAADQEDESSLLTVCRDNIMHRLDDPRLGVKELADRCQCHPDHLSRLARQEWGLPVLAWITARRMERAQAMLATPTLSMPTIARTCGFADSRYFSRVFKNHIGFTPTQYRQQLATG